MLVIYVHPLQLAFEALFKETKKVDTRLGVDVQIKDVNDNAPTFNPQSVAVSILESTTQGQEIVIWLSTTKFISNMQLKQPYELILHWQERTWSHLWWATRMLTMRTTTSLTWKLFQLHQHHKIWSFTWNRGANLEWFHLKGVWTTRWGDWTGKSSMLTD